MDEHQIDVQLDMLYKWYTSQTKGNSLFSKLKMPSTCQEN